MPSEYITRGKGLGRFKLHLGYISIMNTRDITLSEKEQRRQAVDSLRGYIYQIYQSIAAWLNLKENEILFIEVAEDYAILCRESLTTTQVKNTRGSGSITLNTQSVKQSIESFWSMQESNQDKEIYYQYLTTSEIGKERGILFPNEQPGLLFWRTAAREGSDLEPLREVLRKIEFNSASLKDFIKNASAEDLRKKLLRRIRWESGAQDHELLEQSIKDSLVYLGEKHGISVGDSEKSKHTLISKILDLVVESEERKLTHADLLRSFDEATSIQVPLSMYKKGFPQSTIGGLKLDANNSLDYDISSSIIPLSKAPLPSRIARRKKLVGEQLKNLALYGILWLHGSSGLGKTTLAQLLSKSTQHEWYIVELRNCSPQEARSRLYFAQRVFLNKNIGGLILDDFPTEASTDLRLRLSLLASEISRHDALLIITSTKPPPSAVQNSFQNHQMPVLEAPYLSEEDINKLVAEAGGDPKKWGSLIYLFCGRGHPQLVDARIKGLKNRQWSDDELGDGFFPQKPIKEIADTKEEIRQRLIGQLPSDDARLFLNHLSLIVHKFDRKMAIAIAETIPSLRLPGETFESLLGPWIEQKSEDRYTVSPLVDNAGQTTLHDSDQKNVHRAVVNQLLTRNPFPGDLFCQLLVHSLIVRHKEGLMRIVAAVLMTKEEEKIRYLAHELFILQILGFDNKKIFPEDPHLSYLLRMAQFTITIASDKHDRIETIVDKLVEEARGLSRTTYGSPFLYALARILPTTRLPISPRKWMPLLREFDKTAHQDSDIVEFIQNLEETTEGFTASQFIFSIRAANLRGIDELVDLFDELGKIDESDRKNYWAGLRILPSGVELMVNQAWLYNHQQGNINGIQSAETFLNLANKAKEWSEVDLTVSCLRARAVMLDEYANENDAALRTLDEADKEYPRQLPIMRQRAKIFYRHKRYAEAVGAYRSFINDLPEDDHIDRAYDYREFGISAAETGDLQKAKQCFEAAYSAANQSTDRMQIMATGLLADCAVIAFKLNNVTEAIKYMIQALDKAGDIDPDRGRHERYTIRVLGNAIVWMRSEVYIGKWPGQEMFIAFGCCSNPDPLKEIMEHPALPILLARYQLATLEAESYAGNEALENLRLHTQDKGILSCEYDLNFQIIISIIREIKTEDFIKYLPEYLRISAHCYKQKGTWVESSFKPTTIDIPEWKPEDWQKEPHIELAKDVILVFLANALANERPVAYQYFIERFQRIEGANGVLASFFECFSSNTFPSTSFEIIATCIGRLENEEIPSPQDLHLITFYLWQWLPTSNLGQIITDKIAGYISTKWRKVVEEKRFSLRQPMSNIPLIEEALKSDCSGRKKLARIVLAAEHATQIKFNEDIREKLKHELDK